MNPKRQPSRLASEKGKGDIDVLTAPSLPTDIAFRLWTLRPIPSAGSAWNADDPVVFLIADLVAACGGSTTDNGTLTAHFARPAQAVSAAKSIVRAVLEYSSSGDAHPAGVAIAAFPTPEPPSASYPADPQFWLEQAQPGQILVGPETWKHLKNTPGLQFRPAPLPASALGPARKDIHEVLWAPQETFDRYSELVRSQQPSPGTATVWIQSGQLPDLASDALSGKNPEQPLREASDERFSSNFDPDESSSSTPAKGKALYLVSSAAVAVVLVIAFVVVRGKQTAKASLPVKASSPVQVSPRPAPQPSASHVEVPIDPPVAAMPKVLPSPAAEHPATHSRPRHAAVARQTNADTDNSNESSSTPPSDITVDGFTTRDIPSLIRKADQDGGDGRFDDARREYGIVLKLEPNNADAKKGLHRLTLREGER